MNKMKLVIILFIFFYNCSETCILKPKDLVENNNITNFKRIIENGYNINCQDKDGFTALHYAVINNKDEFIQYLLKKNADVNIENSYGYIPLYYALENDNFDVIKMLISRGSNKYFGVFFYKISALNYSKSLTVLSYLHKSGLDINNGCNNNETSLHSAVLQQNYSMVKYLIENAAIIDCKIDDGLTPLHLLCSIKEIKEKKNDRLKIIELLIKNGADVNNKRNSGFSILDDAVGDDTVKILIKNGAKLNKVYRVI